MIKEEKRTFFSEMIVVSQTSSDLCNHCNTLLGKNTDQILPNIFPKSELPEQVKKDFTEKIQKIIRNLNANTLDPEFKQCDGNTFSFIQPVTEEFVKTQILRSPKNFCELDPMPANLFMECRDTSLRFITKLVNKSLESGVVPSVFKKAILRPLIKKNNIAKSQSRLCQISHSYPKFQKKLYYYCKLNAISMKTIFKGDKLKDFDKI